MKVIMNSDDFGMSDGVNKGTVEAMQRGVVSSTTMCVNMPGFDSAIDYIKKNDMKNVGLHLIFTGGKPILPANEVSSLVDEEGKFLHWSVAKERLLSLKQTEIAAEIRAQYNKVVSEGVEISHIDCHHHFLLFYPHTASVVVDFAKEVGLPIRTVTPEIREFVRNAGVKTVDYCELNFYNEGVTLETIKQSITSAKEKGLEIIEFMVHPAYVDADLRAVSSYSEQRADELVLLTSEEVKHLLQTENVELVDWHAL
ncbi:MAG: carbohydrate deacetylase [Bacilli bacterium]